MHSRANLEKGAQKRLEFLAMVSYCILEQIHHKFSRRKNIFMLLLIYCTHRPFQQLVLNNTFDGIMSKKLKLLTTGLTIPNYFAIAKKNSTL
jgi:hypothetical protein